MKKLTGILFLAALLFTLLSFTEIGNTTKTHQQENMTKKSSLPADQNSFEPDPGWSLVWSDEFKEATLNADNWNYQVVKAGHYNDEWQRYTNTTENAYIENDCLVIRAIHESDEHGMDQYTSARLNTANKQTWKYGKFAARIKLPQGNGMWPAFWMLGANINENGGDTPWPQSGEIDILEMYGSKDNAVVECNLHFANSSNRHQMMGVEKYKLDQGIFADDFHVFALEWDENRMAWSVDGEEYASTPITAKELSEFHEEFFILLNVAVGGRWAGRPDDTTSFPQHMYVDWVRVYERRG